MRRYVASRQLQPLALGGAKDLDLLFGGSVDSGQRLSTEEFWHSNWQSEERNNNEFIFAEFAKKYLPKNGGSYIEIGCAPGTGMAFFAQKMGYKICGVDFCALDKVEQFFKERKINTYELIHSDFLIWESPFKYDLVASYGFIEHFENVQLVVEKHVKLMATGGLILLGVPNLRYFNWLIYRLVSPSVLKIHNLKTMDPKFIVDMVKTSTAVETVYSGYWGSSFFQFSPDNPELGRFPVLKKIFLGIGRMMRFLRIDNIGNRFFSPYIVVLLRRRSE